MKLSPIAATVALLLAAGVAGAQSSIPGNQVDDFGPFTYASAARSVAAPILASHSSAIPANQIDDFGPVVSERAPARQDDTIVAGGEPGMDVMVAERAREKAAIDAWNQEQKLRAVWAPNP